MTQGTGLDVAPQHGPLVPDAAAVERARRRERLLLFTAIVLAALGLGLFVLDMFRFMPSNAWGTISHQPMTSPDSTATM